MKNFLLLSLLLWATLTRAQNIIYEWAKNVGGINSVGSTNYDQGNSITVDGSGNVYVTGQYQYTADFDPGPGIANLTAAPNAWGEIFFAKYDALGNYIWAKGMGGAHWDAGNCIAVDGSGNVYITGYFRSPTVDFDPGPGVSILTSYGIYDIFFAKYDASGNYLWAKNIGSGGDDRGNGIAVDGSGNVYITGIFHALADFDPGPGTANLGSMGGADVFCATYDASGNYLWAKRMGGSGSDNSAGITLDAIGNIYIAGSFQSTADFDPGAGTANLTSAGSFDIFFAKYNPSGNYLLAKQMGGTGNDAGGSIALDGNGNICVTGFFMGAGDYDPGAGTANLTPVAGADIFFAKYDVSGSYLWAKSIGNTGNDAGSSITADANGNVYVTGSFYATADFDPGAGTVNLTSVGLEDVFFAKYDASGNYLWAKSIGGVGNCSGHDIAIDSSCNVYITGYFSGTADFDIGAGTANLISITAAPTPYFEDVFFAKYTCSSILATTAFSTNPFCYGQCTGTATATPIGGTQGYTYSWNPAAAGQTTQVVTGLCSGIYTVTVTDAVGATTTATVAIAEPPVLTASIPTVVNVNCNGQCTGSATVTPAGGTPGYTYFWNTVPTQTNAIAMGLCAGSYTCTITDANGCDTIQTLAITEPAVLTAIATSTSTACGQSNGAVNVNAGGGSPGYSYTWNTTPVHTTATVTGLNAGNYTVTITDVNNCMETTTVTVVSLGGVIATSQSVSICSGSAYTLPSGTAVSLSGIYKDTLASGNGCDSVITTTLTVNPASTANQSAGICHGKTYTLPGGTVVSASGTYKDTLTSVSGCDSIITTTLTVNPLPIVSVSPNVTITQGTATLLTANGGSSNYQWSSGEVTQTINVSPIQTTTYCLTVTDNNGCTAISCVIVTVIVEPIDCSNAGELYLPNAFSPNGDGENDFLQFYYGNIKCIKTLELTIYDRWGEKMLVTDDPNFTWDGTCQGNNLNTSVFVYYLEAMLISGEQIIKKGNVSLTR